jgi:hypothetical protein
LLVVDEPIPVLLFQQFAKAGKEMTLQRGQQRGPGHGVVVLGKVPAGKVVGPNGIGDLGPRRPANRLRGQSGRKSASRFGSHGQGR